MGGLYTVSTDCAALMIWLMGNEALPAVAQPVISDSSLWNLGKRSFHSVAAIGKLPS